ncbi:hypothetical protein F5B22DRAFT_603507 [Xylaria bambusicola]|uniref:uncharacterized protein n=1 Tax=Xylaria bambusicola TaxID=326684 RepID=UPI0020087B52|nr:uncharacterized protein F5B22DRAFT_603507 [Xylaria bambusicola]KAI0517611.1 hypothetical protein F5B22DRAFT_603507 [Xylaria bambusicola]
MAQPLGSEHSPAPENVEEDEDAEAFAGVLSVLDKTQLPFLGQDVFQRIHPQLDSAGTEPVVGEPMYGSYNVLFPLTFPTGLCWLVKIHINGTPEKWDDVSASSLVAEAKTMQLLKRETTIPLPEVFDFSSTTQNVLRCPYILMSFISGVPLHDVWFGHQKKAVDLEVNRAQRTRALESIASAMIQLGKFSFPTSGSLVFANDGSPSGTGQTRRVDHTAGLDRMFIHGDPADDPIYANHAAFSDPKSYYTFMLNLHPTQNSYQQGINAILLQLISWIPEPNRSDRFVLTHPDFDIQNFIVSEDGELQGIIDWDGVVAVPHTIGNMRYPAWLTCDWDPLMYGYQEPIDQGVEPSGTWEDSPSSLTYYRRVYKDAIAKGQNESDCAADLCRMSLITDNLSIAADDPKCRTQIVFKVVEEVWERAGKGRGLDLEQLIAAFAENKVDVSVMDALHGGFNALLKEEGL